MIYVIFVIFGLLPSLIWLLFYLKKDRHPESKKMIIKMFFYGMLAAVMAFVVEVILSEGVLFFAEGWSLTFPLLFFLINQFVIVALVEEVAKYFVVRKKAVVNTEYDEPVDAMIYMIIAALGFAALENILILFTIETPFVVKDAALISSFRFLGATFLHALASGTIGYFLGLSFYNKEKRVRLVWGGMILATVLHGLFNISIIIIEKGLLEENMTLFLFAFIFLIAMMATVSLAIARGFHQLNRLGTIFNKE